MVASELGAAGSGENMLIGAGEGIQKCLLEMFVHGKASINYFYQIIIRIIIKVK